MGTDLGTTLTGKYSTSLTSLLSNVDGIRGDRGMGWRRSVVDAARLGVGCALGGRRQRDWNRLSNAKYLALRHRG